jgi:hypothetical protein
LLKLYSGSHVCLSTITGDGVRGGRRQAAPLGEIILTNLDTLAVVESQYRASRYRGYMCNIGQGEQLP